MGIGGSSKVELGLKKVLRWVRGGGKVERLWGLLEMSLDVALEF